MFSLIFTVVSSQLKAVDSFKYLGHIVSAKSGDNDDFLHKMRLLLFARTNVLLRKFNKCNTDVKLCLFKTYVFLQHCYMASLQCHCHEEV